MDTPVYTLLIVESPTIASIIQKICPPSVYVISTDGYCWRPKYDFSTHQIKAIADPAKRSIRNELKEQAKIAGTIVVVVDSDASGDFIAWSVGKFIKSANIKRSQIQSLSKSSIYSILSDTSELDESALETRLKNRFLIHHLWKKYAAVDDQQLAGLISIFGSENSLHSFRDEYNQVYKSTRPVHSRFDEWMSIRIVQKSDQYCTVKPLSTYDVLEYIITQKMAQTGHDAQLLLNQLFQTILPFSEESLISYPRTSSQAFYGDTWTHLRQQYLKTKSVNHFIPTYLQEIADTECPHESIHPIDLSLTPDKISGELSRNVGDLYRWIYNKTVQSLSMPEPLKTYFINDLNPDVVFYSEYPDEIKKTESIRPCLTISELGIKMSELGVTKPSDFGKTLDKWISNEWIFMNDGAATPGKDILKNLHHSVSLRQKLVELHRLKDQTTLSRETVMNVITS